jgi:Peptidase A4 family
MKPKNLMKRNHATITVLACMVALSAAAAGQSDTARAIYSTAATIPTNIAGVHTFPTPGSDFKPITASDEELATYGFPPRPDQKADPHGYALWERAMIGAKHRWAGELKPHPEAMSRPAVLAQKQSPQVSGEGVPLTFESENWSGVANTNTLTKWNAKTSFGYVYSQFNVPVVQQAFDVCDGYYDWEVTWNGIDGAKDGTVLQGGSSSQAYCKSNKTAQYYYAWVEWYPSYPILEEFSVNPGDDIYVATYDLNGACSPGYVYVEDETTLSYGTYELTWQNGPCLIGNSAEIIVERPYGDNNNFYPLANYIWDFALSWDYQLKGTEFGPGATSPTTYIFDMVDDNDTQVISYPVVEGKYSVFFYDTGCAYTGGCIF